MKKFLRYIFTIALFGAMCFGGYKYITDWGKPEEVDIAELDEQIVIENSNLLGQYTIPTGTGAPICDGIRQMFLDAIEYDAKYLITDAENQYNSDGDEDKTIGPCIINVFKTSSDTIDALINKCNKTVKFEGQPDSFYMQTLKDWKEFAVGSVEGLGHNNSSYEGYCYLPLCNEHYYYDAFGEGLFIGAPLSAGNDFGNIYAPLIDNGLSLKVNDAELVAMYFNEVNLTHSAYEAYALVKANLKCEKNEGKFQQLEWLPKMGESKEVYFIITMTAYADSIPDVVTDFVNISNIAILE